MKTLSIVSKNWANNHGITPHRVPINDFSDVLLAIVEEQPPIFERERNELNDYVLIRKTAFSLNYRDRIIIQNSLNYMQANPQAILHGPIGSEFVGIVEETGKDVMHLKKGDRVIANGTMQPGRPGEQSRAGLPSNSTSRELEIFHMSKVMLIPNSMDDATASSFTVGAQTAYSMIRKAGISQEDRILITSGTSNTSLFLINALKDQYKHITVLSSSTQHHTSLQLSKFIQVVSRLPANESYDVVFDPFSDINLPVVIDSIRPYGRYITCGLHDGVDSSAYSPTGKGVTSFRNGLIRLITNNITIIGNCLGTTQDLQDAISAYNTGKLKVIVDSTHRDGAIGTFLNKTFNDRQRFGKVVYFW